MINYLRRNQSRILFCLTFLIVGSATVWIPILFCEQSGLSTYFSYVSFTVTALSSLIADFMFNERFALNQSQKALLFFVAIVELIVIILGYNWISQTKVLGVVIVYVLLGFFVIATTWISTKSKLKEDTLGMLGGTIE